MEKHWSQITKRGIIITEKFGILQELPKCDQRPEVSIKLDKRTSRFVDPRLPHIIKQSTRKQSIFKRQSATKSCNTVLLGWCQHLSGGLGLCS